MELEGIGERPTLMDRANVAAVLGVAVLSVAGCGFVGMASGGARASTSFPGAAPGSACLSTPTTGDSTVMVEWVDFVQLHGTQFLAGVDGQIPAVAADQLGPVVGRVGCELSVLKFRSAPGRAVDGDAAFVSPGTEVHAVRGYPASCRIAVPIAGVNRVYLAQTEVGGVSRAAPCAEAP